MKLIKQLLISATLLIIPAFLQAQTNADEKMKQVENGLVGRVQITGEKPWNLAERMAYYKIHGLSIAVIQNYKVIWAKGYGFANDSSKTPVTAQTLFQAASISKSLNAVGVMKLVQQKKLDLDADINNYLTTWKFPYDSLAKGKKITLANLLSHSSGLNVHGFGGYEPGVLLPTLVQVLNGEKPANTPRIHSLTAPGLRYEYSGGGITISQLIVMEATHQPYADYMKNEVLKPLGMNSSTFAQPATDVDKALLATAYNEDGKTIRGKYHIYPEQAAAGLWTNPTDLAKYIIAMQQAYEGKSTKLLNEVSVKQMFTVQAGNDVGFGVFISKPDSTFYFSHDGANAGFRARYIGSFEGGNGVIVMVNSNNDGVINEVINSVASVYGFKGLYHPNIKTLVPVATDVLKTYTGKFLIGPPRTLTITEDSGRLFAQAIGDIKRELYPQAVNHFFFRELPYELEFNKDADGKQHLIFYGDGGKMELKRAE